MCHVWLTRYPVPTDQERLWALAQGLHRPESFAAWCGAPRKLIRKAQALVATALAGSSEVRAAARRPRRGRRAPYVDAPWLASLTSLRGVETPVGVYA